MVERERERDGQINIYIYFNFDRWTNTKNKWKYFKKDYFVLIFVNFFENINFFLDAKNALHTYIRTRVRERERERVENLD